MKGFIQELSYLYHAVYNRAYFKNGKKGKALLVEGLRISLVTQGLGQRENEPISFIVFAKDDKTFEDFLSKTGWFSADSVSFLNSVKSAFCNLFNLAYNHSPLTPYFWQGKTQNYNLQKSTLKHTIRERHHARIWKTDLKTKTNKEVYLVMASFDRGMGKVFSHTIDPNIDKEREFLFKDFKATGMIESFKKIAFQEKMEKKIFNGDSFFTDGKGYLIYLK